MSPESDEETPAEATLQQRSWLPTAAAAGAILLGVAFVLFANRGSWFYLDDWDFAVLRGDFTQANYLQPQNQNWVLTTTALFQALTGIFGFSYLPFRLVAVAVLATIAAGIYVYGHRRVGALLALAALAPVFVSPGWEILLWPFQIGQLIALSAGLWALILIDRHTSVRGLVGAAALLVLSVVSSSAGVPMLIVVLVDRLLTPGKRRQVLVGAPALLLYGWWFKVWGAKDPNPNPTSLAHVNDALRQTYEAGQSAVQSILGFATHTPKQGLLGQVGFFVLVVVVFWRLFGPVAQRRARILALAAGLVGYWVLLCWGRSNVPNFLLSPRYLYISVILLVLLAIELGASIRDYFVATEVRFGATGLRALGALTLLVVAVATAANLRPMLDGGQTFRVEANAMRGQTGAMAIMTPQFELGAPFYLAPTIRMLGRAGSYYAGALQKFGDKFLTEGQVKALPEDSREWTDGMLLSAYSADVQKGEAVPPSAGAAPAAAPEPGMVVRTAPKQDGRCVRTSADVESAETVLTGVRAIRVTNLSQGNMQLLGHRYSADWSDAATLPIAPGTTKVLTLNPDQGTAPWTIGVRGKNALICSIVS